MKAPQLCNPVSAYTRVGVALLWWLGTGAIAPLMAQTASISNISNDVFACMRRHTHSAAGHVVYNGSSSGRLLVFARGIGQVGELTYSHNASQNSLSVSFVRGRAPLDQVRNGMINTATRCRNGSLS